MIRPGTPADYLDVAGVYRRASLSNAGDRPNLLAHPEHLVLEWDRLEEGRTLVSEERGSVQGFASWIGAAGSVDLEDLFVDPEWMRHGVATALVRGICDVLRTRGISRLEVTANPHALGFYQAVGFRAFGDAMTEFGPAPRMALVLDSKRAVGGKSVRSCQRD